MGQQTEIVHNVASYNKDCTKNYGLQFQLQNTTDKSEQRFKTQTIVDHLKVELFIAVYFNKVLHCYDEA